jgi:SOS-response transcriptional repressor LexA
MRNIHTIRLANARSLAKDFPTKVAFAERLGKEPTQVSRFMGKNPTKRIGDLIAEQIEMAFGQSKGWLDIDHTSNNIDEQSWAINKINKQKPKDVPLISWEQAGSVGNYQPGDTDVHYPCPEKHSSSTFALTIVGESMYPDFIPGEIIYVDPKVEAQSGSCVVIRQSSDTETTFKQLMFDGSKKYLKALNPNWPKPIIEMLPDAVICGVVIGSYRKRN